MKLLNKIENKMLGRTEVIYSVEQKATSPSRLDLQKEIAKKEKAKAELVVVNNIKVPYGTNTFEVTAEIYSNADDYKRMVQKALAKKSVIPVKEAAPAPVVEEEPAAPVAKEEAAPAEDKKEATE